jgi:protein involved in polysaccharide export with SLBB domain
LASFGLTACDTRSFERSTDGSKIYLDELSEAAKSEARQKIVVSLVKGTQAFYLEVGDEVDIFFNVNRKPTPGEYVIRVGDQLRIEFLSESENARTVTVRPDGRISLPLIGPVVATGHTADALARQLQERYRGVVAGAQITVNVTETHSPLQDFLDMLGATSKGRSITDKVLPDGTISVPLLPPLKARGRTLTDLQNEINASYGARGLNLFVSLVPRALHSGSTYVLGEVAKPGRFDIERPRTVTMAIAQAGGINTSGAPSSVRVFYVGADGEPRVRSINLNEVMNDLKLEQDMIVPDNSIIYVPTNELAQAGRLMDAVVRDILRFNGTALGLGLNLDNQNVSNPAFNPH